MRHIYAAIKDLVLVLLLSELGCALFISATPDALILMLSLASSGLLGWCIGYLVFGPIIERGRKARSIRSRVEDRTVWRR